MSNTQYFCNDWELSKAIIPETSYRVESFIEKFKKFEDFLKCLELSTEEILFYPSDEGVHFHIKFSKKHYVFFKNNIDLISLYLKIHLPIKNSGKSVLPEYANEIENYYLVFEFDLNDYEANYPSHDFFYMSVFN